MPAKGKRRSLRQRKIISYSEDHDPEKMSSESLQPRRKKVNKRQKKQISKDSEEEFTVESIHEETEEEDISCDESDQISTPKDTPKKRICLVTKKAGGKQKSKITPLAKESSGSIRVKVKKRKDSKNVAIEAQKSALEENSKDDDQDKHESIEEKLKDLSIDLDSDFEIDPIFKRYAYDYEKNKYMQKDQRIYPQDRKRIKFIEKIKTKLEAEKERDEDGVPITNINVELSKRNKIVKRRPLEPLSFKQSKENIELSIDQEPLVKSSDAKRTNSKKMAQKEFINKQKEKYAQRIGYLPDYEPPQQSKDSMKKTILTEEEALAKQKDSQEEDGMNQSLKQTLLGTESLQNGDTTIEQMEWELESKLSDKEIEYLAKQRKRIIVYINNNIRMDDNYLLCKAIQLGEKFGKNNFEVIPIYCFNPKLFMLRPESEKSLESDEDRYRSILRTRLILESVIELKTELKKVNSDLLIFLEEPHLACKKLLRNDRENFIVFENEIAPLEKKAEELICKMALHNKTKVCRVWGCTSVHIEDLPYSLDKFPHLFGKFKKDIANISIRELLDPPQKDEMPFPSKDIVFCSGMIDFVKSNNDIDYIPDLKDFQFSDKEFESLECFDSRAGKSKFNLKGGEKFALSRLMEYLWDKDIISRHHYSKTSFFMNGDCSPKLTAWTAIGAISPRRVFLEILKYENKNGSSEQTECVKREMLWKDYFVFWALKHHKVYFDAEYGIYNRSHYEWQTDPEIIKRVKEGKTGMPIIDALVRDFNESGNMSYKAKMIFCNYFSGDLRQDWRKGAEFFEARMIDYEPCEIIGKCHQGAGIGPGRIVKYNCLTQSQDHDPKGEYIKAFVEELRYVPEEYVHDPWRMPIYLQKESSCVLGKDYPKPIPCLRYTKETKGSNVDRTKTSKKGGKILFDNTQSSLLTFIQVTKEKEKYMQQKELEKAKSSKPLRDITEVDKENIEKSS